MIFTVAVPCPLRRTFDYLHPDSAPGVELRPGTRVRVPFGRQTLVGMVIAQTQDSTTPEDKLRAITEVIDAEPLLDSDALALCLWAASYYQHPVGDAVFSTLPTLLRRGAPVPDSHREYWQLSTLGLGLAETSLARAKKQQALVGFVRDQGQATSESLLAAGFTRAIINAVRDKELIALVRETAPIATFDSSLAEAPLALRDDQARALAALDYQRFATYLLFGDTGTGKTEVYLQAIAQVLACGRQALVLVPEINLTPQTLARFRRRFRCDVAVMHSGLSDRERLQAWADARRGKAGIVIGTRSAIFTPLARPGIIILDEEHDPSFKQQDGFRYSARDLAVMRASRENIPAILGSATPALESLSNAARGRYHLLELTERGTSAAAPRWQLVDLKGSELRGGFSAPVLDAMKEELALGNQVLVFLNRRGYAPLLLCHECGWQAECRHCSARMTTHLGQRRLICHHCEARQPIPAHCSTCGSVNIQFVGQGTERSEEVLNTFFPGTRILRLDRDSTRRKQAMADAVAEIHRNEPCILVGTQMVAKGHHFPAVTLAVLLDVDSGLFSTDFRAAERTAQLITQVAGRAGRESTDGRVLIQSHYADHPLLRGLMEGGYRGFSQMLIAERQHQQLPPFSFMALVRAEAAVPDDAENFLHAARSLLEKHLPPTPDVRYLGPLPAALEKRKGFHRYNLSVFTTNRSQLGEALRETCLALEAQKIPRTLRWSVDIDPQETI
ncbi:MAG: primosomal protein N' [Porticoccaceae bacterium]